jgi:phosphate transport system substrate-binding protein
MLRRHLLPALAVVIAASLCGGCDEGAVPRKPVEPRPDVPAGGVLLQGAGATFPSILYRRWFERYHAAHPDRIVSYAAVGSGEGVRRFIDREIADDERVDFGASDAAMTRDEEARARDGALLIPVTAGSVVLAYNLPDVQGDLRLSREAYAGIFLGDLTNWSDRRIARTNPGIKLPNLTIATVVRQDSSGTTFAFTSHLDAVSSAWHMRHGAATLVDWPGNAMRATGNEGVTAQITRSTGSIGYVGGEFARQAGLRSALLENHSAAFVAPSSAGAAAALRELRVPDDMRASLPDPLGSDAYPIVTLTWILLHRTYADSQKAVELRDLFRWCLTDGQRMATDLGYIPLPLEIARRSLAELDRIQLPAGSAARADTRQ